MELRVVTLAAHARVHSDTKAKLSWRGNRPLRAYHLSPVVARTYAPIRAKSCLEEIHVEVVERVSRTVDAKL